MRCALLLLVSLMCQNLFAGLTAGTIIQVSRKIRMSNSETTTPKEFFVDLGQRQGIREGDVFDVIRIYPVMNPLAVGPWDLMKLVLGELKIFSVGELTSIGRVLTQKDTAELPSMDFPEFMLGDQVQLKTSLPFQ